MEAYFIYFKYINYMCLIKFLNRVVVATNNVKNI